MYSPITSNNSSKEITADWSNEKIMQTYNPNTKCCDPNCQWLMPTHKNDQRTQSSARFYSLMSPIVFQNDSNFCKKKVNEYSSGLNTTINHLPNVVLIHGILLKLSLKDVIAFGTTCKEFLKLSKSNIIWKDLNNLLGLCTSHRIDHDYVFIKSQNFFSESSFLDNVKKYTLYLKNRPAELMDLNASLIDKVKNNKLNFEYLVSNRDVINFRRESSRYCEKLFAENENAIRFIKGNNETILELKEDNECPLGVIDLLREHSRRATEEIDIRNKEIAKYIQHSIIETLYDGLGLSNNFSRGRFPMSVITGLLNFHPLQTKECYETLKEHQTVKVGNVSITLL